MNPIRLWTRIVAYLLLALGSVRAENPPPSQLFYVPFPEDQQLQGFAAVNSVAADPLAVFITFSAATDGTVIYYDHWEDGYEEDITNPVQATTLVFGDGNSDNGYPPGNAGDLIPAGTVFNLRNFVTSTTLQSNLDYDARDKIASFKPISITKTCFPDGTDTLMAGCLEMFEFGLWGTEYRSPVGVDMPQSAAAGNLTYDENVFSYVALSVMAGPGGASVQIDKDNNGVFEETVALAEGQSLYRDSVNTGGRVLADRPVQTILFTGTIGSNYATRDTNLLPVNRWSSDYFAPVSTRTSPTDGTVTFLYNPGTSAITVSYDYRSSATAYTTASVSVPAGGNARVALQPANGSTHFGAYRFYTTGTVPPVFYAMSVIDADAASGGNQAWDGGFTLVGRPSLTTQVLLSLGIGRDPYSTTNLTENGNPVWFTTVGNGHTQTTVYVDYNGDNAGSLTDPNGNKYDVAYNLRELEQQKVFDPDGDQSGMLIYTLIPSVRIAAAWGQDPATATAGAPGLDVASLIPPLREGEASKKSTLAVDADGDGRHSAGDTFEYDIRAINSARTSIPGPFTVQDALPVDTTYVPGSTKYRFSVGGNWQGWTSVPDDASGTPYPLDGAGLPVSGSIQVGQQLQVVFRVVVDDYSNLTSATITNNGVVEISPYGLVLPIQWTDVLYGSIGNRVWNDLDGDGVQEAGEDGIAGVDVFADQDGDGVWDTDEPKDTTDSNGEYLLTGLVAGTYQVRVDTADIAAVNVGFGPSYDLDGVATSHLATVALAGGQDRVDADFGYRVGASVGNRVWMDRDGDGVQESSEPGINGIRVYLDLDNDNTYDAGEPNTITSGDGTYYIGNLDPGTYTVRIDTAGLPGGASQTYDLNGGLDHEASVTLIAAEHRGDLDFGYRGTQSIGDLVWEDVNADGLAPTAVVYNVYDGRIDINSSGVADTNDDGFIGTMRIVNGYVDIDNDGSTSTPDAGDDGTFLGRTIVNGGVDITANGVIATDDDGTITDPLPGEPGIANVRVYVDANGNEVWDSTEAFAVTNWAGAYSITSLFNGTYTVRVESATLPSSYVATYDLSSPVGDHTAAVTLSGTSRTDVDFGYRNDASISDLVWNDRDADGIRDAGEPGIEGVLVYVDANGNGAFDQGSERYAITDVNGLYRIENFAAGTYTVRIEISTLPQGATQTYDLDGTGSAHQTSRTLAVSEDATNVDFGYRANAAFGNYIWNDIDADGVQDSGESGIADVRVFADLNGDGVFDPATEPAATSDTSGAYLIGNLVPGTYTARVDASTLPAGVVQTYDPVDALDGSATFFVSANQTRTDIDFGYTTRVTVGDFVWNDQDADGQKDPAESGLSGVNVTVYNAGTDAVAGSAVTGAGGGYVFSDLMPGSYYVVFERPAGMGTSPANLGPDASDSDANVVTGKSHTVTLTGGQADLSIDAGFYHPGAITGSVMADTDNDNDGDAPIASVVLTLRDAAGNDVDSDLVLPGVQPTTTTTAPDGSYRFTNLAPGSYRVAESHPSGYLSVADVDGGNLDIIGDITAIPVIADSTTANQDFIEEQPGAIAGAVLIDTNNDGTGDDPLAGVTLTLLDGSGNPVDGDPDAPGVQLVTADTDSKGNYHFNDLPPGTYGVSEAQPDGYLNVSDKDGGDLDRIHPIVVPAGGTSTGNNFIEEQPGAVSGSVLADIDNDGGGDMPIPGVTLTLLDSNGATVGTTTTAPDGSYSFTNLAPGSYRVAESHPSGYLSVADVDGGNLDLIGDVTVIPVIAGSTTANQDFIEEQPGSISGSVLADIDNDGDGDTPIPGVTLTLLDSNGATVGTTSTAPDGSYSFTNLAPGSYRVVETHPSGYLSADDEDGGDLDIIGDVALIAVTPGASVTSQDFIEEQPGTIGDYVWMDLDKDGVQNDGASSGVNGVTVELLDSYGSVLVTTITADDGGANPGFYHFGNLSPGTYSVRFTAPTGLVFTWPSGDLTDSGNSDSDRVTGETAQITLTAGDNAAYLDAGLKCPDTWSDWKLLHPGEDAAENLDADAYDSFAEYAFAMPDDGTGSGHLDRTAWIIQPSTLAPGTLEAVFVRPTGWNTANGQGAVTYVLQYAASAGQPTVWQEVTIDLSNATVTDNGDCTETAVIHDIEALTGLIGGTGVVRIKATQADPAGPDSGATTYSEPEGWTETPLEGCCQTYGTPYQRETVFTGTVDAVAGQDLAFVGNDLTNLLAPGVSYYAEVLSGDNAGQRFDVAATGDGTVTLAADADILSAAPPFNTLATVPASLAGDTIAIRPHWTLGGLFPVAGLVASNSNTSADQVQTYAAGAWTTYWLYDLGDADPATARWVKTGDPTLADQSGAVIPPGQGMFFTKRVAAAAILSYGEIRTNPFVRPLATGAQSNLVSGGYPVDQSPLGRELSTAEGFLGTKDFKTADSIFVWQNDASPPFNSGYDTYWLLHSTTPQALNRWVKQGDSSVAPKDAALIFEYDRAVFLRTAADQTTYRVAAPWAP